MQKLGYEALLEISQGCWSLSWDSGPRQAEKGMGLGYDLEEELGMRDV